MTKHTSETIEVIDPKVHLTEAVAQMRIASALHTIQGGEAMWSINNVAPMDCERCMNLAAKLMRICNVWPS